MSATAAQTNPGSSLKLWIWVGLAVIVGLMGASFQGFWMDEASAANIARQVNLADWWDKLINNHGSDTQMPLYMLYLWGWVKMAGHSEFACRAGNVPWLLLGMLTWPRRQVGYLLALLLSPFLWFYLNESRPYIMQIGSGLLLAGATVRLADMANQTTPVAAASRLKWTWLFCAGLVALSGSSLLGMIWAGAVPLILIGVLGIRSFLAWLKQGWLPFALSLLLCAGLAGYYFWTLGRGDRATPGNSDIKNVLFVAYELCGFSGFGPGRNALHGAGLAAFQGYFILSLAAFAVMLGTVLILSGRDVASRLPRRIWLVLGVTLGGATAFLLAMGVYRHFSVLGRHFAPLSVAVALLFGTCLQCLLTRGGFRRGVALAFVGFVLVSCLSLRFCERHLKDDYRDAAQLARAANTTGHRVWWCADTSTGLYYQVPLHLAQQGQPAAGEVWAIPHPTQKQLTNSPLPDVVFLSKPELHDSHGVMQNFLAQNSFHCTNTLPAFGIWGRP